MQILPAGLYKLAYIYKLVFLCIISLFHIDNIMEIIIDKDV